MVISMNIKKMFLPLFLSILFGYCCGRYVCKVYKDNTSSLLSDNKVYMLQIGAYSSLDSMKKNTKVSNYIYYVDDGLYKSVLAITGNRDNIDKIKSLYDMDVVVNEYYLDNYDVIKKINEYDVEISSSSDEEALRKIVTDMVLMYQDNYSLMSVSK